jgi:hypothetical protein
MNKTLLTAVATAALLPLGATAMADTHASEKTGSDMYVGISAGKVKHNIKFKSAAVAAIHDDNGGTSMTIFVGRDLSETFAIEGFYANHGKSKFTGTTDTLKGSTMGIAGKAGTDLTDDFRAFVKVGYHSWKSESDTKDDGTDVLYGIGLEYKLSATTAIVAGYDRFTYDDSNMIDMSIGIKYRF